MQTILSLVMHTGTISDLDTAGQLGLIDADDGRLVLFNLQGVEPQLRCKFSVGSRVKFDDQDSDLGPRAAKLSFLSAQGGRRDADKSDFARGQ
jgi:cold shock CspA family protein